jgi:endonuclease YncB( thermonuclease family)
MATAPDAFVYNATLERIVDGDTFDCCLDLGFDVKLHKQRVRLAGIDTPESRTRDLAEKKLGLAAKERLKELCIGNLKVKSLGKGKYGRILGIPYTQDGEDICQMLIDEVMQLSTTEVLKAKFGVTTKLNGLSSSIN